MICPWTESEYTTTGAPWKVVVAKFFASAEGSIVDLTHELWGTTAFVVAADEVPMTFVAVTVNESVSYTHLTLPTNREV